MLYSSSHEYSSDDVDIRMCVSFTENRPNGQIPPKFQLWHHNPAAFQEVASDKVVHISDGMHDNTEV